MSDRHDDHGSAASPPPSRDSRRDDRERMSRARQQVQQAAASLAQRVARDKPARRVPAAPESPAREPEAPKSDAPTSVAPKSAAPKSATLESVVPAGANSARDQELDAYRDGYDSDAAQGWTDADAPHHAETARAARRLLGCPDNSFGERCRNAIAALKRWALSRSFRKLVIATGLTGVAFAAGFFLLWWRLGVGPINVDFLTPWMAAAIEDNFGADHHVDVGGTQIERAGRIRMALRLRDIVVRDKDNAIVASAPKAEVRVSGARLLMGRLRAESLNLVGAELSVRIAPDGRVSVSAGGDARPLVTADTVAAPTLAPGGAPAPSTSSGSAPENTASRSVKGFLAALSWIDSLSAQGLDGYDLNEIGVKNGVLVVDDKQSGRQFSFENVTLSLRRPRNGGAAFGISAEGEQGPWNLLAAVGAPVDGVRTVDLIANKLSTRDILLALHMNDMAYTADLPLSGRIRGEIGRDGLPTFLSGKLIADSGAIVDRKIPEYPMAIDRMEIGVEWDSTRRTMVAPFQIIAGANRFTLLAHVEPPNDQGPFWQLGFSGGSVLLAGPSKEESVVLNRIAVRMQFDTDQRRIILQRADVGNGELSVAGSGHIDYSTAEPRMAIGFAGTPMSVAAVKRLWPITVTPEIREWVINHIESGAVQRLDIGINAPMHTLARGGPPVPEEGLSVDITATGVTLQPVESLPPLRGPELRVHVTGRTATVTMPQASIDTPGGRKLALNDVVFEVPDTAPKPATARVRFRADGPVPAAAEILSLDRLSHFSGTPVDPNGSKGTLTGQVSLSMPLKRDLAAGETSYALNVDLSNFAAERMIMGQKLEGDAIKIAANNQGFQVRGDVRLNGLPATIDYRKPRGDGDAELRLAAVTDDAARAKLGFDVGSGLSGPVSIKLTGRIAPPEHDSRFNVDADLTAAKVDNLLPGWIKPSGKAGRAQFMMVQKPQGTRFEDVVLSGSGTQIKGTVELNGSNDLVAATFPVYQPSDADKATLRAERVNDGTLKVTMRGDVFDGRGFIKAAVSGSAANDKKKTAADIDLDIKIGAVAGYYGEALRTLDLRMSRRNGAVRSFAMSGKLGRDAQVTGDLRGRSAGREVVYLETGDAGAFFRFTDTYPKMFGGQMWIAMDPPGADEAPKEGLLNVRDFHIKGESALDKVVAKGPHEQQHGVPFSAMRVEFTRQPGRLTVHDGVVRGPVVGATIDGNIDYASSAIQMRGTFVPLYGINNMFGQIPIVGIFLGGGSNEGLLGVTYEVVGSPGAPVLRVNPISAVAPGLLRKFFEFPMGRGGAAAPADRPPQ